LTAAAARVDARAVVASAGTAHPRDLLVWHGFSAVAMTVMLTVLLPPWLALSGAALFAVGITWCMAQSVRRAARTPYLRLAVCCLAMVVMLLPRHAGRHAAGLDRPVLAASPGLLTGALVVALVCVAVAAAARSLPSTAPGTHRAFGLMEGVLAAGMAAMLAGIR